MPAMFLQCAKYIDDGANFIHGNIRQRLLEVSTDGFIKCSKHPDEEICSSPLNLQHQNSIVEVKCPFPNDYNVPIHYNLPEHCVTQILAGMCVKGVQKCIYISHTSGSTTFFDCNFDKDLWQLKWSHVKEIYDVMELKKPSTLHANIPVLKNKLQDYCNNNVHFICELPSMNGIFNEDCCPPVIKNSQTCPMRNVQNHDIDRRQAGYCRFLQ